MKDLLSILGTIGLTATSTTSLVACDKPNNNENGGDNKPEQPPTNSKWKLIDNSETENINNNKTYIGIAGSSKNGFYLVDWKKFDWKVYKYKSIYRWDGVNNPETFKIDNTTGKITDWNEKTD